MTDMPDMLGVQARTITDGLEEYTGYDLAMWTLDDNDTLYVKCTDPVGTALRLLNNAGYAVTITIEPNNDHIRLNGA